MILAIDPGPKQSAYCVWGQERILAKGIIPTFEIPFQFEIGMTVACEHLQCFGMAVGREVFETAYWIGEFRALARANKLPFVPVFRSEVKMHFCRSMRAKDTNIRQALIDRLGAPGTKKAQGVTYGVHGDMWSALAIAVYVYDKHTAK